MPAFSVFQTVDTTGIPRVWINGIQKANVKFYGAQVAVSGGTCVFWLTSDNTSAGTPIFSEVFTESFNFYINDPAATYAVGGYTISEDKKSLTVTVNKQIFSSGNVILNLLGTLTSVLTGVNYSSAPNGTIVYTAMLGI